MKPINARYSLRDYYSENGKSLKHPKNEYWDTFGRYPEKAVCRNSWYFLIKKMYLINGWHKMDVLHSRLKKGHCFSDIRMALDPKHKIVTI